MSIRWCLLIVVAILLGGCQGESGALVGSSTGGISGNTLSSSTGNEQSVSLAELVGDPSAFVGDQLLIAGDLSRPQVSKCSSKSRTYPARWILSDGDFDISIANISPEIERLSRDLSGVVVYGRWLHWEGMVGCGQEIHIEEQWYLNVERVESPNPVAFVPVVPAPAEEVLDASGQRPALIGPEEQVKTTPSQTALAEGDGQTANIVTPSPQQADSTQTPIETAATLSTAAASSTVPLTSTPEEDQGLFLSTATSTLEVPDLPTTVTPTSTSSSTHTPLATATVNAPSTIFQMALDVSSIETGNLGVNEVHRWTHEITSTKQLTVNLASDHLLDLMVSIVDPAGHILIQQNDATGQEPEILGSITLMDPGVYDILVSSPSGEPGYYAILINDDDSYPFLFQGTLLVEDTEQAMMAAETDHFWHFAGTSGQIISLSIIPFDNSDLFLNLFGTDGTSLIRFHDETTSGETEQLISYVLPDTGIYSLRVGEYNFGQAEYEIFLTDG